MKMILKKHINYQKGFIPIVLLILVIIAVGAGTVIFLSSQNSTTPRESKIKLPQFNSPIESGWNTYANQSLGVSIRYPQNWSINSACEKYNTVFFGYTQETLGNCEINLQFENRKLTDTGFSFGAVVIEKEEESFEEALTELRNDPAVKESFPGAHEVTVAGNRAIKIATTVQNSDNPLIPNGTRIISYLINSPKNIVYHIGYYQQPTWQNQEETFEKMVKTIKFL